jgi:hypothetical protein
LYHLKTWPYFVRLVRKQKPAAIHTLHYHRPLAFAVNTSLPAAYRFALPPRNTAGCYFYQRTRIEEFKKYISSIIETSNIITKDNLSSRIPLPQNRDELYVLSKTINNLLDRIENTIERENSRLMLHMN